MRSACDCSYMKRRQSKNLPAWTDHESRCLSWSFRMVQGSADTLGQDGTEVEDQTWNPMVDIARSRPAAGIPSRNQGARSHHSASFSSRPERIASSAGAMIIPRKTAARTRSWIIKRAPWWTACAVSVNHLPLRPIICNIASSHEALPQKLQEFPPPLELNEAPSAFGCCTCLEPTQYRGIRTQIEVRMNP